ncbi:MAG: hypothetical protein DCC67_15015 [Planctomycetota bacterium]|nr:MAG: hypothetical protein DCC67_15015 [Planctomycetota bacterium]
MPSTATSTGASYTAVPAELRERKQWVLWRSENGAKVPYQPNGSKASSTNSTTWTTFEAASAAYNAGGGKYAGIGYVFCADDPYTGIDLDDCRNVHTGEIQPWAQDLINRFDTYAEVSPSQTGVKLWVKGQLPTEQTGKKAPYELGQIEVYDSRRYFAVTGQALTPDKPIAERQSQLDALWSQLFPGEHAADSPIPASAVDVEACWSALEKLPDSVSGDRGHDKMLRACCEILRHGVTGDAAWKLIERFNVEKCDPPWSRRELEHKWKSANDKVLRGREFGVITRGKRTYRILTSAELATTDFKIKFLIEDALVAGQPLIIAGPQKSLKTSFIIDAAVSLASGAPFLGRFNVSRQSRVMVMSGESGLPTIKETAERVCRSKDAKFAALEKLFWSDDLPTFGADEHIAAVDAMLSDYGVEVLIVDPLYLALPGEDAANAQVQGRLLRTIGEKCERHGTSMVLAHHTKKTLGRDAYQPLETSDMSYSAAPQFARQWWLLNRRERYPEGSGEHRLWLSIGGSAGHSSIWGVDVTEGVYCALAPRRWVVSTFSASQTRTVDASRKASATLERDSEKVKEALRRIGTGETAKAIRGEAGLNPRRGKAAIQHLVDVGAIRPVQLTKSVSSNCVIT